MMFHFLASNFTGYIDDLFTEIGNTKVDFGGIMILFVKYDNLCHIEVMVKHLGVKLKIVEIILLHTWLNSFWQLMCSTS